MNIAIIGAGGFIGRHLVHFFEQHPQHTLFLFTKSADVRSDARSKKIDFFDRERLVEDFKTVDVVYYLASETIPATSWHEPALEIQKNLLPFLSFLENISPLAVRKIVFVSSAGTIYGATSGKVNEDSDKKPFSPYGIIKLTMEHFLNHYEVKAGLKHDIFRVSNVYGEGQNTGKGLGVINTFLEKIIAGQKVNVFGDGSTTRNYIYVKDVAQLLASSIDDLDRSGIYNISSDATLSLKEILELIRSVVDEKMDVSFEKSRQSDNTFIDLDNSRILNKLKDFSFTPIRDGIEKTYRHLKTGS